MAVNHEDELDDAAEDAKAKGKKKKVPDCTLDAKVKKVMEMITDMKAMVHTLKELEVNTDQMPLGKLSKNQIKKAFNILKQIDTKLTKKSTAGLQQLSADFYTLVPHDFGMCKPTIINSASYLQKKMELLDCYGGHRNRAKTSSCFKHCDPSFKPSLRQHEMRARRRWITNLTNSNTLFAMSNRPRGQPTPPTSWRCKRCSPWNVKGRQNAFRNTLTTRTVCFSGTDLELLIGWVFFPKDSVLLRQRLL